MFPVVRVNHCDVCGHTPCKNRLDYAAYLALKGTGCGVAECPECGFVYLSPRPAKEVLAEFYETSRDVFGCSPEEYESGVHASVVRLSNGPDNSARRLRLVQRFGARGTLLDVGAGRGRFMHLAERAGFDVTGIEPGKHNREFAAKHFGMSLIPCSLEDFETDISYDVVHCSHVLEHVWSPATAVRRLYSWTKVGGLCVIEVPNQLTNVFAVRNRLLRRYPQRPPQASDIIHLSFWDSQSLVEVCKRSGFRVIETGSWYLPGAGASAWRLDYWLTRAIGKFVWGAPNIYVVATKP